MGKKLVLFGHINISSLLNGLLEKHVARFCRQCVAKRKTVKAMDGQHDTMDWRKQCCEKIT